LVTWNTVVLNFLSLAFPKTTQLGQRGLGPVMPTAGPRTLSVKLKRSLLPKLLQTLILTLPLPLRPLLLLTLKPAPE
jgi:hypothetical protein